MATYKLISEEASIVLVGSFNPAIFHPEWLIRHELVPPDDIKAAKVEIVHNDLSKFSLGWLAIDVLRNKFIARTNDPSKFSPLRDLIISAFDILAHTPITQLGMNLIVNYSINTEEDWHKIGDTLAPKQIWEDSLPQRVGLKSLTIQSPRPDNLIGGINVTIGPTDNEKYGIYININNHVELSQKDTSQEQEGLNPSLILVEYWDNVLELSRNIAETTIVKSIET